MDDIKNLKEGEPYKYTNKENNTQEITFKTGDLKFIVQLAPGCKFEIEKFNSDAP